MLKEESCPFFPNCGVNDGCPGKFTTHGFLLPLRIIIDFNTHVFQSFSYFVGIIEQVSIVIVLKRNDNSSKTSI